MRTPLVGRDGELAVLRAAFDAALGGRPGLVLCRGEPGIGKTRLVEELCGSAGPGAIVAWGGVDGVVPPTVRETIEVRLARLPPGCVPVLRAASIVGARFAPAVVAEVVEAPLPTCLGRIDEGVAAGFIEPVAGEYRFGHALVRSAIEAGLGAAERAHLHRRAADAVQRHYRGQLEPHLSDLARHWAVAATTGQQADRVMAANWIERAGVEAMRRLGYEEAARLFVQALDLDFRTFRVSRGGVPSPRARSARATGSDSGRCDPAISGGQQKYPRLGGVSR